MADACQREPGTDALLTCPYNKSHQILTSRFNVHLVRCRKTSDKTDMKQCRFNSSHMVREMEINYHETVCPDRRSFATYKYTVATSTSLESADPVDEPPETFAKVETAENWDNSCSNSYNPEEYVTSAPVIRLKIGGPPSEKKEFRLNERKRLGRYD